MVFVFAGDSTMMSDFDMAVLIYRMDTVVATEMRSPSAGATYELLRRTIPSASSRTKKIYIVKKFF
jgi:hypothetical protein